MEKISFATQLKSMLKVDFRRMFKTRTFYILIICALVMPILMTVMTSKMDGAVSRNLQTGEEVVLQGPENSWQNIGPIPGKENIGGAEVFGMCNINLTFMCVAVFVCLFISEDFKSGYAKNLFTVRAGKGDYVISKIISGFICGVSMLVSYFIGSVLGGAMTGLSFELGELTAGNLVMCMLGKTFLMLVFVSIFVLISLAAKQKTWLALCGSFGGGMLLFMMISMITPLNSSIINVIMCLGGGVMFAGGLGFAGKVILNKTGLT